MIKWARIGEFPPPLCSAREKDFKWQIIFFVVGSIQYGDNLTPHPLTEEYVASAALHEKDTCWTRFPAFLKNLNENYHSGISSLLKHKRVFPILLFPSKGRYSIRFVW